MPGALYTDLYEITMAASYLHRGMVGPATFSLFVRDLPPDRGFLVAAGLEDCLSFLESFSFEDEDIDHLRDVQRLDEATLRALRNLRFTGDVWAIPEGTLVLADEPLLEVTAPIAEAQLVETCLLNQMTFQTAIASKAARCFIAARGRDLVDFSFRRTHGTEAAMAVARTSAIAGFVATSNVEAARRYGLQASGTMAHSYVEAFPTEADAFRAFATDFPDRTTFLVDTYDTIAGVRAAIDAFKELRLAGRPGIRLDSGDLVELAFAARSLLDEAGLESVRILASGSLDEFVIDELMLQRAPIDAFGVGTKMGVSSDAPSLDSAYKLVQYGMHPVMKLSTAKITVPGAKQVFRASGITDTIALREETPPTGARPLMEHVMTAGRRTSKPERIAAAHERFLADLAELPGTAQSVHDPVPPSPSYSKQARTLTQRVRETHAQPVRRKGAG